MRKRIEEDWRMEETEAVDLARLAPPPHRGRTGGGLNPPRGVTAARPSFIICGLRQGLEDLRLEEICVTLLVSLE